MLHSVVLIHSSMVFNSDFLLVTASNEFLLSMASSSSGSRTPLVKLSNLRTALLNKQDVYPIRNDLGVVRIARISMHVVGYLDASIVPRTP
jgi:hypothetical protein